MNSIHPYPPIATPVTEPTLTWSRIDYVPDHPSLSSVVDPVPGYLFSHFGPTPDPIILSPVSLALDRMYELTFKAYYLVQTLATAVEDFELSR